MADRIVQLIDKDANNVFPVVATGDAPVITVTSTDPGEGSSLAANHFVAVTGTSSGSVGSADLANDAVTTGAIADGAVTADKIDYSSLTQYTDYLSNIDVPTTERTFFTYNIPESGTYFFAVNCSLHAPSSQHATYISVKRNGTVIDTTYQTIAASAWGNMSLINMYALSSGDTITVTFRDTVGISQSTNTRLRLSVFRVG